jgi:hypothetical protein
VLIHGEERGKCAAGVGGCHSLVMGLVRVRDEGGLLTCGLLGCRGRRSDDLSVGDRKGAADRAAPA